MAFKSMKQYDEDRYNGIFMLKNDGDWADVVILYRSTEDVLVGDTHYIKSPDYSGYVHCLGRGCPACAKGLRVQPKLFVPLYVLKSGQTDGYEGRILFFDRNIRFEPQLQQEVFSRCPNPSEYVFRITRRGAAGSVDTKYVFELRAKNGVLSYDDIMAKFHTQSPDMFEQVCKSVESSEMSSMFTSTSFDSSIEDVPEYVPTPRVAVPSVPAAPLAPLDAPEFDPDDSAEEDELLELSADSPF